MKKKLIGNRWDELLADEWEKPYYRQLRSFLIEEYKNEVVYPPAADIYNALRFTDYDDVKVVILGQDPYHEPGQAHGLAFSVPRGTPLPPSLVNILKELKSDLGIEYDPEAIDDSRADGADGAAPGRPSGILDPWAAEGVLLLNTVLSVRAHRAASHAGRGWEQFTDRVIELLAQRTKPMVFVLWGAHARSKKELIIRAQSSHIGARHEGGMSAGAVSKTESGSDSGSGSGNETGSKSGIGFGSESGSESGNETGSESGSDSDGNDSDRSTRHLILEAPHPSPLSAHRGFFGGCYFSRCNYFLEDRGMGPVDWSLGS